MLYVRNGSWPTACQPASLAADLGNPLLPLMQPVKRGLRHQPRDRAQNMCPQPFELRIAFEHGTSSPILTIVSCSHSHLAYPGSGQPERNRLRELSGDEP